MFLYDYIIPNGEKKLKLRVGRITPHVHVIHNIYERKCNYAN